MENSQYPIGRYARPASIDSKTLDGYIATIEQFPQKLKHACAHLNDEQLDTPYRTQGWTIRQVVHHCADSHMNAYIRFKLALTEETPVIKPYKQANWAELPESKTLPIQPSLTIIQGLHERWAIMLRSLDQKQWALGYVHPEQGREIKLDEAAGSYAWHGEHHLAHITGLKQRQGWL
jgi:hypothetical protein